MSIVQNTSSLISSIYKSRMILLDLMNSQGYYISEYEGFSINEVNTMKVNNQLDMILRNPRMLKEKERRFIFAII